MNIVLGLDPGTHTGWAIARGDRLIESGTRSFEHAAEQSFGVLFIAFRKFLQELRQAHGPLAAIAYELPFTGYGAAIAGRITTGMGAHILERCATWRCRPLPVNTMTLKKFATGSGKAKKPDMIVAAARVLGVQLPHVETVTSRVYNLSEHEADAIHIARWGAQQLQNGSA